MCSRLQAATERTAELLQPGKKLPKAGLVLDRTEIWTSGRDLGSKMGRILGRASASFIQARSTTEHWEWGKLPLDAQDLVLPHALQVLN